MKTLDPVDTYFDCISSCYLDEDEASCLNSCVDWLKNADIPSADESRVHLCA